MLEALSHVQKAKHTSTILQLSILKGLDKLRGKLILYSRFLFINQKQQALHLMKLGGNKKIHIKNLFFACATYSYLKNTDL